MSYPHCYRVCAALAGLLAILSLPSGPVLASSRVAVIGIHAPAELQARATQLTPLLRDAFHATSTFSTFGEDDALRVLVGHREQLRDATFVAPARDLLKEARIYAEQAQFGKAIDAVDRAGASLLYYREQLTSNEELIQLELMRIYLYLGLGDRPNADAAMRTLAALAPEQTLDPARFAPEVIRRFNTLRGEMASNGALQLESTPNGANIFLDGRARGTTPATLTRLPGGYHFVRLEDPVAGTWFQELELEPDGTARLSGQLHAPVLRTPGPRARPDTVSDAAMLVVTYQRLGRTLDVDFVPVAFLDDSGLEIQLLEVASGHLSPAYQASLDADSDDVPQRLRNLIAQLEALISPDGHLTRNAPLTQPIDVSSNARLPTYYFDATADRAGVGGEMPAATRDSRLSKPLYRRAWFWTVVGGVVLASAGGTVAGVMAAQGPPPASAGIQFNLPTP